MKVNAKRLAFLIAGISIFSVGAFAFIGAHDRVKVTFDHPVYVQGDKLPAGSYTIETMMGKQANDDVMDVYGKNNQHFKTSFTTFSAEKLAGAKTTHVTLLEADGKYYLDKVLIQGREYGYQVVQPEKVESKRSTGKSHDYKATSEKMT